MGGSMPQIETALEHDLGIHRNASVLHQRSVDIAQRSGAAVTSGAQSGDALIHDLRNMLSVIQSSVRLAESNSGDAAQLHALAAAARSALDRAVQLTDRLRCGSRVLDIKPCELDVSSFIRCIE